MSRKSPIAGAGSLSSTFDAIEAGRLTWVGLLLAAIGWILLIGEITTADVLAGKSPWVVAPSFHTDLVDVAICIIASGLALAIIGALQTGFGALNRFFEAVLMRSSHRDAPTERPMPGPVEPEMASPPTKRPYRILADGSVEVETIVGTRKFSTLDEAKDFI